MVYYGSFNYQYLSELRGTLYTLDFINLHSMNDETLDGHLSPIDDEQHVLYAGFWSRFFASIVDGLAMIPFILLNIYNMMEMKSIALELLILAAMIVYKPLMERIYGATLGKMALSVKVVNERFKEIDTAQAIKRFTPWIIGHIVSVTSIIMLYSSQSFEMMDDWMRIAELQASQLPMGIYHLGTIATLVSGLAIFTNEQKQCLHDKFAKTYCINK